MKTENLHIPMPKISKRLKLLLAIEISLLLLAYSFIIHSHYRAETQKSEKAIQQLNYSLMTTIQYSTSLSLIHI